MLLVLISYRFLPWLAPPAAHARPRFGLGELLFDRFPDGRCAGLVVDR